MPAYRIVESIHIDAPPQRVFDTVVDFNTWTTWSPWLICEPEARVTVSEDSKSVGSKYEWQGDLTGQGQIIHKKIEPGRSFTDELTFLKPFKAVCSTGYQVESEAGGCKLTWTMNGSMPWFLFFMVPTMKTFLSMDFRRGLAMIKDWVETGAIASDSKVHGVEMVPALRMAGIEAECLVEDAGDATQRAMDEAQRAFQQAGLSTSGMPLTVYTKFRVAQGKFRFISGYEIGANEAVDSRGPLRVWSTPATKAFRVEHVGSYRHLGNAWAIANGQARHMKLKQCATGTFEIYRNAPGQVPEEALRTDIYLPLK